MDEKLIKQAIANCHLVNLYGIDPGMEEGMCAGLRTMNGRGEPCDTCQECRLQYQYTETHKYYSAGDEAECLCPVCDSDVSEEDDYFCPTCGQALKYHDEPN